MISSPCKECRKKNSPKDQCLKTCSKIREIQAMQQSINERDVCTTIDFSDTTLFYMEFQPVSGITNRC
jgi:hypothetical protein